MTKLPALVLPPNQNFAAKPPVSLQFFASRNEFGVSCAVTEISPWVNLNDATIPSSTYASALDGGTFGGMPALATPMMSISNSRPNFSSSIAKTSSNWKLENFSPAAAQYVPISG